MKVEINHLDCGYHDKTILKNVSLTIREQELWCVLGANGIGKTTFFKTLLRLLKPLGGEIYVNNRLLSHWKRKELAKKIAYVPQSHIPPFAFSVKDVIAMGRNPYQSRIGNMTTDDKKAVESAVELLGIGYLYEKNYQQISGGERQLTLITRAIAQETPILVLDEPVVNLDFGNQARVLKHVTNLVQQQGRTVIMTTHMPDHSFLEEANVLLFYEKNHYAVGKGREVVTEEAIETLYHIDNHIVPLEALNKTVCIPD